MGGLGLAARRRLGAARHGGLPEGDPGAEQERGGDDARRRDSPAMAAHDAAQSVTSGATARPDRPPLEVIAQVGGELGDRAVALLRLGAQRLEEDGVEVARELASETPFFRFARRHPATRRLHALPRQLAGQRDRRARRAPVRQVAGEQLVEHDAERVDVDASGRRLAEDLLGRRVLRRHQAGVGPGQRADLRLEHLGDAEVEELGHPGGVDQDIRRLQVAVDDQPPVRRLDRVADREEEAQARRDRQVTPPRPLGDRRPRDPLEREPGQAVLGDAAVEQARDRGVLEGRDELALEQETRPQLGGVDARAQDLDRGLLLEGAVRPARRVDRAHPALAEQLAELPGAEAPARVGSAGGGTGVVGCGHAQRLE